MKIFFSQRIYCCFLYFFFSAKKNFDQKNCKSGSFEMNSSDQEKNIIKYRPTDKIKSSKKKGKTLLSSCYKDYSHTSYQFAEIEASELQQIESLCVMTQKNFFDNLM